MSFAVAQGFEAIKVECSDSVFSINKYWLYPELYYYHPPTFFSFFRIHYWKAYHITLAKDRPSTKSGKTCRTVPFLWNFPLFWAPSIIKKAQKMMDGYTNDTRSLFSVHLRTLGSRVLLSSD
jgi:hypothetical protein